MKRYRLVLAAAIAAAWAHASCGSDPVRVDHPPVIEYFSPQSRTLTAFVGDTLRFTVRGADPEADPLTTSFLVNGSWKKSGPIFDFAVVDTGLVTIGGRVSDGRKTAFVDWRLRREAPPSRPPVIHAAYPIQPNLELVIGGTMEFQVAASDPNGDPLEYAFLVDDSLVSRASRFVYRTTSLGIRHVRAVVSDGVYSVAHAWQLTVTAKPNLAPVIDTASPAASSLSLVVGNSIEFTVTAHDPEGLRIDYAFLVDDMLVHNGNRFTYQPASDGVKRVRAVVSDGVNNVERNWQVTVSLPPDPVPPAPVVITLAETGVESGQINIEWTAVGDDGMEGIPSFYQVRTSAVPILTEADWAGARNHSGVPVPGSPGSKMRMAVGGLAPGQLAYVVVRALDEVRNLSALVPPAHAVARSAHFGGRVIDSVTWQGIPNVTVKFGAATTITDAEGVYEFSGMGGEQILSARDEDGEEIGAYYDYDMLYRVKTDDVVKLCLIPVYPLTTTYYADFLEFFRSMTDQVGIPYPADQRRRDLPIALYAPPFVKNGLDYAATIRSVAAEFDAFLGGPVFYPVNDATTEARVETAYNGIISRDRYNVITWTPDWYPLAGLIEFRVHYSADVVEAFKQIVRHELTHSLGLFHSLDPDHLMVGYRAATAPTLTSDEVAVLRTFYAIPRGYDVRRYQRN